MKILIAEDDPVSRTVLEKTLLKWDYDVQVTCDGAEAWDAIQTPESARLLILDWMMPEHDGPELCQLTRALPEGNNFYILLLTAKTQKEDIVTGLDAGADDYVTKPFHRDELRARVSTGCRILQLQSQLASRIGDLESALSEVNRLSGLLPICAYCKRIRKGDDYWQAVEHYIAHHSQAQFSHGVCPDCYEKHVKPELEKLPE